MCLLMLGCKGSTEAEILFIYLYQSFLLDCYGVMAYIVGNFNIF